MNRLLVLATPILGSLTLGSLLSSAAATAAPSVHRAGAATASRRNICLIQFDSWDGRVLGCLDHPAMRHATPNCDRLAARGVVLRNTYCSHPICCPSRANMWSGQYTHHCRSWNNYKGLEPGAPTFQNRLQQVGYQFASPQGGIGKLDYRSGGHSQLARITAWTAAADIALPFFRVAAPKILDNQLQRVHAEDWALVDRACQWLDQHHSDPQPFFLYVSMGIPHPSFTTSRYWLDKIDQDAITIPPQDDQLHPVMRYQQITKNWTHGFDDDSVRKTRAIYYAMCAEADAMVGQLLDKIDGLHLANETYILFTSDHGENNMEHRQWYKMNMYESSARVPLIVAGPGVQQGAVLDNIVPLVDLYPTFMEMGRTSGPDDLDGQSLLPLLTGRTRRSRNWALAEFTGCTANTSMFMLRQGEWKYIAYPGYGPQLFDLNDDPEEIHNLAQKRSGVARRMDDRLRAIVDYPQVHQRWIQYCKESFRKWRQEILAKPIHLHEYGADILQATYQQILANTYLGWNDSWSRKLDRWLASPD